MNIPLSPCVPENLVSRDGFSRPVPRQPAHLHTQAEFGAYLRDSFLLYAVNACIVSRAPQRLAKMMEVIVEVCRAFALTVSAKNTETMCMPPPRKPRTMVRVEAAGQIYEKVKLLHLPRGRRDRSPGHVR